MTRNFTSQYGWSWALFLMGKWVIERVSNDKLFGFQTLNYLAK
jgi:hypothetical protein